MAKIVAKWRRHKFLSEADQRRLMIALQKMRMSCDSTYLLDGETDFGGKADELVTRLDEIPEQPGSREGSMGCNARPEGTLHRQPAAMGRPLQSRSACAEGMMAVVTKALIRYVDAILIDNSPK